MSDQEAGDSENHGYDRRANRFSRSRQSGRASPSRFNGDESVLKEFFLFFHPVLLDQARRHGVELDIRDDVVVTFLDDKVLELAATDLPPKALVGYVIRSFRNRIRNLVRDHKTRMRIYNEAAVEGPGSQLLVAECHSQYGSDTVEQRTDENSSVSESVRNLALFARSQMSNDDVRLLIESSQRIPLREIAKWHKMSYAACRTRIHRLRTKTRALTHDYLRSVPSEERQIVERFLRRAGALED